MTAVRMVDMEQEGHWFSFGEPVVMFGETVVGSESSWFIKGVVLIGVISKEKGCIEQCA